MKNDPPVACKEVGNVKGGFDGFGGGDADAGAKNAIRNKAAEMGANYVRMETAASHYNGGMVILNGTAYKCP